MSIGGPILNVSLAGRQFAVAADADGTRKMGGFENEVSPNGDGSGRTIKTRVNPTLTGLTLAIDDDRSDAEYIQDLQDGNPFDIGATFANGATMSFRGVITGETGVSTMNATASMDLTGVEPRAKIIKA